jgi:hypothetical protein
MKVEESIKNKTKIYLYVLSCFFGVRTATQNRCPLRTSTLYDPSTYLVSPAKESAIQIN